MTSRLSVVALLGLSACSFPSEGVPLGDDILVPDAETAPDACVPVDEACDGVDNDCDGNFDEGFASGAACDGPDDDLCPDDMMVCGAGGGEVCGDTSIDDDNVELCNGPDLDEDCDGVTDEGYGAGTTCDGGDTDLCSEGVNVCAPDGLGVVCNDATGDNVELCDTVDQDCDGAVANGFDVATDEDNCGDCNNPCSNGNGTTSCLAGHCTPVCSIGSAQCNIDPDDGCELQDTNPACDFGITPPALINGDAPGTLGAQVTLTGTTEGMVRVRLNESDAAGDIDITGRISMVSGAGADYDMFVHCLSCGNILGNGGSAVLVGREDAGSSDSGFDVVVEVRYDPTETQTTCAAWTVTVAGGVATPNRCGGN